MASTTPNLLIPLIATSQNNKEITANTAFDLLDEAMNSKATEAMSDADYVVPTADALENIFLEFTGTLSANRNVTLPSGSGRILIVQNLTENSGGNVARYELIFKVGTGSLVFMTTDANPHLIYSDGLNSVYQIS